MVQMKMNGKYLTGIFSAAALSYFSFFGESYAKNPNNETILPLLKERTSKVSFFPSFNLESISENLDSIASSVGPSWQKEDLDDHGGHKVYSLIRGELEMHMTVDSKGNLNIFSYIGPTYIGNSNKVIIMDQRAWGLKRGEDRYIEKDSEGKLILDLTKDSKKEDQDRANEVYKHILKIINKMF